MDVNKHGGQRLLECSAFSDHIAEHLQDLIRPYMLNVFDLIRAAQTSFPVDRKASDAHTVRKNCTECWFLPQLSGGAISGLNHPEYPAYDRSLL